MFSTVLKEVTGILDRRFLMNAFFPSLLFWGLLIVVGLAGQRDLTVFVKAWNEQDAMVKILQIIGFIAWVTFFAGVLSSQLTAILRFYEGYWDSSLGRYFQAFGQKWHKAYLARLSEQMQDNPNRYEDVYLGYPLPTRPEEVMPTRLGNILKNAELYPKDRYQMDAVLTWPRLYNLFPERYVQTIAETRGALDFMLVLSALGGSFAFLAGAYLLIVGATWWLFLICFWGGLLVAWLAYRSALDSALLYAQQIKSGFDLYRNELLKQMRLPLPATPNEEEIWWDEVDKFLYRNVRQKPQLWAYTGTAPASPDERKDSWLQRLTKRLGL